MSEENRYPETSAPGSLPLYPSSRWMIILQKNFVNGTYFMSFSVFYGRKGKLTIEPCDSESLTAQEHSPKACTMLPFSGHK